MPESERIALARRVRDAREALGLTQTELAVKAGVELLTIQQIETARTGNGLILTFIGIAKVLGMSVDALVGLAPANPSLEGLPLAPPGDLDAAIQMADLPSDLAERFRGQRQTVGPMPVEALISWAKALKAGGPSAWIAARNRALGSEIQPARDHHAER